MVGAANFVYSDPTARSNFDGFVYESSADLPVAQISELDSQVRQFKIKGSGVTLVPTHLPRGEDTFTAWYQRDIGGLEIHKNNINSIERSKRSILAG